MDSLSAEKYWDFVSIIRREVVWDQVTYEVDTDGGDVGLCVGVVGESQKKARLSNTGVTDEEKLEEIIVSVNIGGQFRLRELVVEYLP